MPAETALEILMSREKDARIRDLEAKLSAQAGGRAPAAQAPAAPVATAAPSGGVPSAMGTRQMPTGGQPAPGNPVPKSTAESSLEELEAHLEEQFKAGARL